MNIPSLLSVTPTKSAWLVACCIAVVVFWKKKQRRSSSLVWLSDLPDGPKPSSWMAGCFNDLTTSDNIGSTDQVYVKNYGLTFKMSNIFGTDMLYLADPQGLHYVLESRPYIFHKEDSAKLSRVIFGPSILGVEGPDHVRQRRILAPGFHPAIVKDLVPVFAQVGMKLTGKWSEFTEADWRLVDVQSWLSRTTLDAIGQGVFSYDFGSLEDSPSKFLEAYKNVFFEMLHKRTPLQMTIGSILIQLPFWLMKRLKNFAFRSGLERFNLLMETGREISSDIIQREIQATEGRVPEGKDVMSNLVRANFSQDTEQKMEEEELLSQTLILTIAGHETSASTLAWILYELAHHPECQKKLREEVMAFRASIGGRELKASDFESQVHLPYTSAIIKETLRFHPIAPHLLRNASFDETIPLSQPIKTRQGKQVDAISLRKGQTILISLWSYNRVKELWGADADTWNPDRFLNDMATEKRHSVGIYANLGTFSGGVHSCIGWRFAVLELHTLLTILIEKFEFGPPPQNITIMSAGMGITTPIVKGQENLGSQLPLRVRPITY